MLPVLRRLEERTRPAPGVAVEVVAAHWSGVLSAGRGAVGCSYTAPVRVEDARTGRSVRLVDHVLWVRIGAVAAVLLAAMWRCVPR